LRTTPAPAGALVTIIIRDPFCVRISEIPDPGIGARVAD